MGDLLFLGVLIIKLWDIETGKCIRTFEGHQEEVESVAFSPDGKLILSGSYDDTIRLWDIKTGRCLRVFVGHQEGVNSVCFSPDGRYALSGSSDNTIKSYGILRLGSALGHLKDTRKKLNLSPFRLMGDLSYQDRDTLLGS